MVGHDNDASCLELYKSNLPEGSTVMIDAGFPNYCIEEVLEEVGMRLYPTRNRNSRHLYELTQKCSMSNISIAVFIHQERLTEQMEMSVPEKQ